jgi:hypothetical protein
MKRRIVQRIERQRWTFYVQRRRFGLWRDADGPFTSRPAAMDAVIIMRARDDYGGYMPWEGAKLIRPID